MNCVKVPEEENFNKFMENNVHLWSVSTEEKNTESKILLGELILTDPKSFCKAVEVNA